MSRSLRSLVRLLPISLSGVALGHVLVYRWLFPPSNHVHAGADIQHRYMPAFVAISIVLAIVSLVWYVYLGYKESKNHIGRAKYPFLRTAIILFLVQSALFFIMEIMEQGHGFSSSGVTEFLGSQLFAMGVLFQLITAAFVALSVYTATVIGHSINRLALSLGQFLLVIVILERYLLRSANDRLGNRGPPTLFHT